MQHNTGSTLPQICMTLSLNITGITKPVFVAVAVFWIVVYCKVFLLFCPPVVCPHQWFAYLRFGLQCFWCKDGMSINACNHFYHNISFLASVERFILLTRLEIMIYFPYFETKLISFYIFCVTAQLWLLIFWCLYSPLVCFSTWTLSSQTSVSQIQRNIHTWWV